MCFEGIVLSEQRGAVPCLQENESDQKGFKEGEAAIPAVVLKEP